MKAQLDEQAILDSLRRDGVAKVPGFIVGKSLDALRAEFDLLFAAELDGVKPIRSHPSGPSVRVKPLGLKSPHLSQLRSVFHSEAFARIAREYLPPSSEVRGDIVATHDVLEVPIAEVHFDLTRALKFYLYLEDTDESNGQLSYASGTHSNNESYRRRYLAQGGAFRDLQNVAAPDEEIGLLPMGGEAGTLLVFDTEGWHTAALVREGSERRILRGACVFANQPTKKPRFFSPQWLRESVLNPVGFRSGFLVPPLRIAGRQSTGGSARSRAPVELIAPVKLIDRIVNRIRRSLLPNQQVSRHRGNTCHRE